MARQAAAMLPLEVTNDLLARYRQLPAMLQTSGLGATFAFLTAKATESTDVGRAYRSVADGLRRHLAETPPPLVTVRGSTNLDLVKALAELTDPVAYARASAEAEALAAWLKRLAEASHKSKAPA